MLPLDLYLIIKQAINEAVLEKNGEKKEVINKVQSKKLKYLRHIMRNNNTFKQLKKIFQGKVFR
jgi:hypothetical protein